jgi:lysophospholipase L1-like esterase
LAAVPLLLAADTCVALARGWRSANSVKDVLLALAAVVLAATGAAMATRAGRLWLGRAAPRAAAALFAVVLAWAAAEWVAGSLAGSRLLFHRSPPGARYAFAVDPRIVHGIAGESRVTINALGLRGPELPPRPAAWRLLCIGGSTTQCLYLDDEETWPALLCRRLAAGAEPVWVGNAGQSGYGTWHHVRLTADAEFMRQFDAALFLVGVNDFMRALQGRRIATDAAVEPLWTRSRVYGLVHNAYLRFKERRQNREETTDADRYAQRRRARREQPVVDALPDLAPALAEFRANVETLIADCTRAGVAPFFATQPVLWREGLSAAAEASLWLGHLRGGGVLSAARLRQGMQAFNAELLETCAAAGVPCVDLVPLSGREELFYDDCHLTEAGARAVADALAGALPPPPR